jgi:folate-binding protein YgfZ
MAHSALYNELKAAGARLGEYAGTETALAFTDPRSEYAALRSACGIYDLDWRAKIVVRGKDRTRWLNGMVTNNVRDLPNGQGVYSFLLNPQGHILADMYIYNRGDYLVLGTERAQAEKLLASLKRYIIMDQVELTDVSDTLSGLAVQGPNSPEVMSRAGFDVSGVEPMQLKDSVWREAGISLTRMASADHLTYEVWASAENIGAIWSALVGAGAQPVGTEALELFRVAAGIPKYGQDIRERELPQETEQMQALNFNKGCYIGQEIVERIRSRGNVHRKLTGFVVQGPAPPLGTKVVANGKEVGEITSTATVPTSNGDQLLALGYVRREAAQPGTVLDAGNAKATVEGLPFKGI